jgi:hypothetical protein
LPHLPRGDRDGGLITAGNHQTHTRDTPPSLGSSDIIIMATSRALLVVGCAMAYDSTLLIRSMPRDGSSQSFMQSVDKTAAAVLNNGRLSCHARDAMDLSGDAAYVWGMNFHVADAATCCQACAAHQQVCGGDGPRGGGGKGKRVFYEDPEKGHKLKCGNGRDRRRVCNAWVYCAAEQCFSYDIHVHRRGECWLKHEPNMTAPIAAGPTLPQPMRDAPRSQWPWAVSEKVWPAQKPPERLQWQSGIVAPSNAAVWTHVRTPGWQIKFCKSHQC